MTITRSILVEKLTDYLNRQINIEELVGWAE